MDKKMILEFDVVKQCLIRRDKNNPVANSVNYLYAKFKFSNDYDNLIKKAIFSNNNDLNIEVTIDDSNMCIVPPDVIVSPTMWVTVKGCNKDNEEEVIIPTNKERVGIGETNVGTNTEQSIKYVNSETLNVEKVVDGINIEIPNTYGVELKYNNENGKLELLGRIDNKTQEKVVLSEIDLPTEKVVEKVELNKDTGDLVFTFVGGGESRVNLGDGGKAIIDVDTLPEEGYVGTTIPNTGTITKLCFNNNLSIEEVESIISKLNLAEDFGQYIPTADIDGNNAIMIVSMGTLIGIEGIINGEDILIFSNSVETGMGFVGFNPEITNFNFDVNYVAVSEMDGMEVGNKNELLSSLFSITPFEYVKPNVDPNYLYRTPNNSIYQLATKQVTHWSGTKVPNSGTVNEVYFNTNLTYEEVNNMLMGLSYESTPFHANPISPLLFSSDGTPVIFAVMNDIYSFEINIATDIANQVFEYVYTFGHKDEEDGFKLDKFTINKTVISEYSGISIGTENSKISSLFSIAPFESSVEKVKEFKEINKPNIVYINAVSETGTFTNEEIELLKGDNTIIIAETSISGVGTIGMIFKKGLHYDVTDMRWLIYHNASGIFGSFSINTIQIDLINNTWQQGSSDNLATINNIKSIELVDLIDSSGEIRLDFFEPLEGYNYNLGIINVATKIDNSNGNNALVTQEAVKDYVDEVVGNINNALASILGEE